MSQSIRNADGIYSSFDIYNTIVWSLSFLKLVVIIFESILFTLRLMLKWQFCVCQLLLFWGWVWFELQTTCSYCKHYEHISRCSVWLTAVEGFQLQTTFSYYKNYEYISKCSVLLTAAEGFQWKNGIELEMTERINQNIHGRK